LSEPVLTLLSVTVNTEGSWMRGPNVAVLMGDGRRETGCLWYLGPADSTGVVMPSRPAPERIHEHTCLAPGSTEGIAHTA
jgi:hypothetical protein